MNMNQNKENYKFQKLTPVDNVELGVYEEALDFVFNNDDIKNVAISGAYSAGKSSVLETYKGLRDNLRFLHVSLAYFDQCDKNKNEPHVLEGKILNQLIHQIPSESIPQTNFRIKQEIKKSTIKKHICLIGLLIFFGLYFLCFNSWKSYVLDLPEGCLKSIMHIFFNGYTPIFILFFSGGLLCHLFYKLVVLQRNKNIFKRLKIHGNEIEIFEENRDSYFDKYLNEVLYLFENSETDVIVFEDLDRFNAIKIFERLREINILINKKVKNKPLRFFYLVRDDIFVSKDRTKFFDYIVPIVPVIDGSNSYEKFIAYFEANDMIEKFDSGFLQGLSLYIDDMRILKNIYNEFGVYFQKLNNIELDYNKMLAIVTYKNLFPKDFSNLQLNKGFVFSVFNKKDFIIENKSQENKEEISKIEEEIRLIQDEPLNSIEELDLVFEDKKVVSYGNIQSLTNEEELEYNRRKDIIENNQKDKISKLKNDLNILEKEIVAVKNKSLAELITRDNIDSIFGIDKSNSKDDNNEFNDVKQDDYFDLLKYLIRNGHIDESYSDYMTPFYEKNLTRNDKIFLRSVTDKKAKGYGYKLNNPKLVSLYLNLYDYTQQETLNFDLFTYLLKDNSSKEQLKQFVMQLKNAQNFNFIREYFDTSMEIESFVTVVNKYWPEMFSVALNYDQGIYEEEHDMSEPLSSEQIKNYSVFTLYYSDKNVLQRINEKDTLAYYLSNKEDYLDIKNPDIDKLIKAFEILNVSFHYFDYNKINKELFNEVYEHDFYDINFNNIKLVLEKIYGFTSEYDIHHRNYTLIMSNPDSKVAKNINREDNINQYIDAILNENTGEIIDSEECVIELLNNENLEEKRKKAYIKALKTKIVDLDDIEEKTLLKTLLEEKKVILSEKNVLTYFAVTENIDTYLIDYINSFSKKLNFSKIDSSEEDFFEKFFDKIITCDEINNLQYGQIIDSMGYKYDEFNVHDIGEEKIKILIDLNIITMNEENLIFLRDNYENQATYYYIEKNVDEYVKIMTGSLFNFNELLYILDSDVNDELKLKLLKFTNTQISIKDKAYSPRICEYILDNNFDTNDIPHIFNSFENFDSDIKDRIIEIAIKNILIIINNPEDVSEMLKEELLQSDDSDISQNEKYKLFVTMMPNMEEAKVKNVLDILKLDEYKKIFEAKKRPKIEITTENQLLLEAFKNEKYITNYEEDSKKQGFYKITKHKPNKKIPIELL